MDHGNFEMSKGGILVPKQKLIVAGQYHGTILRKGEVIDDFYEDNLVVDEGLNALLDIMFHGSTQVTTWYLGVFEGNYTPVAGINAAGIASASTETNAAYDETTRPAFVEAAASSKVTTNAASRATFTFNATKTIYGAFLISDNTKGGTSGTLFSAARFGTSKAVVSGDQLLLTYTFTASSV